MKALGLIIPVVALVVGVAAGAGGALFLAEAPPPEETEDAEAASEETPPAREPGAPTEFAQLGSQFVVPVLTDGTVRALVLVSVTLEVTEGATAEVHALEPRIRDAFLQVLFDHANAGGFDDRFTQSDRMSLLRFGLREAAQRLLGPILLDVLIVDIVRQEA
jgi:flagellar basal body-associated protein FliL